MLAASMQIARQSKDQSDRLAASRQSIEEIERVALEGAAVCDESNLKIAHTRGLLESCVRIARDRSSLIEELITRVEQSGAAFTEVDRSVQEVEQQRPNIERALHDLQQECLRRGVPSRRGRTLQADKMPDLCFGGHSINLCFDQVDAAHRTTGLTTTLFVLAEDEAAGPRFYRVATNITRADGQRATGTSLNPRAAVARLLLKRESTYGYVYILGVPHLAAYAPILDAVGDVIGAAYVGRSLSQNPSAQAASSEA